jgi:hypothetical protein
MQIKRTWVTPAKAKKLLDRGGVNRNLSPSAVEKLRKDMESGRWADDTAETVKVSAEGQVLDGQHRLEALAGSDLDGLYFWIATGVPAPAQEFMDLGKPRNVRDILSLRHPDIQNLTVVGAIARWLVAAPIVGEGGSFLNQIKASGITTHEIVDRFEEDPEGIQVAATEAKDFNNSCPAFPPTVVGYVWYQIDQVDPGAAAEFFKAMRTLSFNIGDDPRKAVYEKAQVLYRNPDISNGSKELSAMLAAILTRGYNAWATGKELRAAVTQRNGQLLEPETPVARR